MSPEGPRAPVSAEVGTYLGLGLTWALSTILFLWLGSLADGKLGTEPVLTLVGAFVGAGAGFYSMVRQLLKPPRGRGKRGEGGERGREERSGRDRG